jgi:integration host factor subunit beta
MNQLELVQALQSEAKLTKSEASKAVNIFFDEMAGALAGSGPVEIRGLCSFYVKKYKAYTGRNPRSGKNVKVNPKKLPFFKCGAELKKRVDS